MRSQSRRTEYFDRLTRAIPAVEPEIPRVGITIVGRGVSASEYRSSKIAAAWGFLYQGDPKNGLEVLLEFAGATREAHPVPYAHWYIDGGKEVAHDVSLTSVSYAALEPARNLLLAKVQKQSDSPGMGPEKFAHRDGCAAAVDLQLDKWPIQCSRFDLKVLTEGSGTQISAQPLRNGQRERRCGGRNL